MDFRLRTLNSPGPGARLAAEKAGATWPPPGQGEGGNVILAIFVLLVVFLLCSPNSAIQFHQLPSRCSIFSPLIWTTAGLLRHKNALIQTLMVVLISMPQRWWQLWNMAWGSETLLWCSWRKNRKARAGESSQGRAPRSTAPPLARARLP